MPHHRKAPLPEGPFRDKRGAESSIRYVHAYPRTARHAKQMSTHMGGPASPPREWKARMPAGGKSSWQTQTAVRARVGENAPRGLESSNGLDDFVGVGVDHVDVV